MPFSPRVGQTGYTPSHRKLPNQRNHCQSKYIPSHLYLMIGYSNALMPHAITGVLVLPEQVYEVCLWPFEVLLRPLKLLLAGIPTIIKPFFGDQFFWADRVEALGIGAGVRKLTVESLKDALVSATTDQKQIDRARLIGKQIRSVSSRLCRSFKHY